MQNKAEKVSFVVPCYNEEEAIPIFYKTMEALLETGILKDLEYEYIFVDDGSRDNSIGIMQKLRADDEKVHFISFSRNFGKEAAILAGLQNADGDYVVTMDVDLQDSPELLAEMYQIVAVEKFDCAAARRTNRKGEGRVRSFLSESFYKVINSLSDIEIVSGARDYRFMNRSVVNAILSLGEYNRFSKGIFSWVGFKTKWIEYENVERSAGNTKWSVWKLFAYAMEGIVAFSTKLLNISSVLGCVCCILSFLSLIFIIVRALLYGDPVAGWPSMMCVII